MTPDAPLLSPKELAHAARRSERYIRYAIADGFQMIGGLATLAEFREWLARNPDFTTRRKSRLCRSVQTRADDETAPACEA